MKSIVMALIAVASITASAKLETGLVCQLNYGDVETGVSDCRVMTYNVNAPSAPGTQVTKCDTFTHDFSQVGYSPDYGFVCPYVNQNAQVPAWLKALNKAFIDAGFLPAPVKTDAVGCQRTSSCSDKE